MIDYVVNKYTTELETDCAVYERCSGKGHMSNASTPKYKLLSGIVADTTQNQFIHTHRELLTYSNSLSEYFF